MPAQGSDRATVQAFLKDIQFREVHAFTWGFVGTLVAITTNSMTIGAAILGLLVYAYTGKKATARDLGTDVEDYVWRQVRREPHYFGTGILTGAIVGGIAVLAGVNLAGLIRSFSI
ncbi:hypothetical protein ACFQH6_20505 [Halobacteriaceae archaeon GCM10025711]